MELIGIGEHPTLLSTIVMDVERSDGKPREGPLRTDDNCVTWSREGRFPTPSSGEERAVSSSGGSGLHGL